MVKLARYLVLGYNDTTRGDGTGLGPLLHDYLENGDRFYQEIDGIVLDYNENLRPAFGPHLPDDPWALEMHDYNENLQPQFGPWDNWTDTHLTHPTMSEENWRWEPVEPMGRPKPWTPFKFNPSAQSFTPRNRDAH